MLPCGSLRLRGAVTISPDQGSPGPPEISGPASIKVLDDVTGGAIRYLATFDVTRVGSASPPACIPQEAGSTFNVILESSSDLVNWTPANPGSYPGLETKRFFRTRIVKQ